MNYRYTVCRGLFRNVAQNQSSRNHPDALAVRSKPAPVSNVAVISERCIHSEQLLSAPFLKDDYCEKLNIHCGHKMFYMGPELFSSTA
jgi:hypothetical protein